MKCQLLVLTIASLLSSIPYSGQILVEGEIVNQTTGEGIGGAFVSVGNLGNDPSMAVSDRTGHFRLSAATPGPGFPLNVRRAGFLAGSGYVTIPSGGSTATVRIELTPQAVISGKLTDEDGFPVPV